MTRVRVPGIHFAIGDIKESPESRCACGTTIAEVAPQSPIFQADADVQHAVAGVAQKTVALRTAIDDVHTAQALLDKALATLGVAALQWDGELDGLFAAAARRCKTDDDARGLALTLLKKARNPLAMPLGIDFKYNRRKDWLYIHVRRAPGMRSTIVQWGAGVTPPEAWIEFDGDGADHVIPNPPAGTFWVRAASRSARGKSDFTTPISTVVV